MMDRFLRLASIVLIAGGIVACDDDTATPQGETSTVTVNVFIDDPNSSDGDGDDPIAGATVTLTPTAEGEETLTAETDADGVATFSDVPAGVYTLTHSPATPITNAVLTGAAERTLVAQFEGGETTAEFVYSYEPGSISVQFFRDENANDTYEEADDTTLAGFQAILFAGDDTTATAVESITVDSTGLAVFEDIAQGAYTILIRPIVGAEVTDTTIAVNVVADQQTDVLVEFTGGDAIATIAQARALPVGSTVTVKGVVNAGTGVYSVTSFYMQDETAGILVFLGSSPFSTLDVAPGDTVQVTGVTSLFSQELQLGGGAALEVEVLGRGAPPVAEVVTIADILANNYQGELVTLNAVTIDSLPAATTSNNWNMRVHDATGSTIIFFDTDAGISSGTFAVGQVWNITGIGTAFNALREVKPRGAGDIVLTSNPGGTMPIATARALPNGQVVTVTGVVTAGATDTVFAANSFYLQDASGGIVIFGGGTGGTSVAGIATGDSVTVTGTTGSFSAEEQITGSATQALTITDHGTGTIPTALAVDAADINAGRFQGRLARVDSAVVQSVSVSGSGNVTVVATDPFGTFTIFGDVDTGLTAANFVVGNRYRVTGVLASFQSGTNPPLYQIKPRSAADVVAQP